MKRVFYTFYYHNGATQVLNSTIDRKHDERKIGADICHDLKAKGFSFQLVK